MSIEIPVLNHNEENTTNPRLKNVISRVVNYIFKFHRYVGFFFIYRYRDLVESIKRLMHPQLGIQ